MIPLARPLLDETEADAVRQVIMSGWVSQGPTVAAFEKAFAAYTGAPYACAVANCTTALHLALLAVGAKPGDEVITVSHSFIATANAVRYCGAEPVFIDIEAGSFNIDPALIEPAITSRTRAILCVHQIGMPCDLAAIVAIARRHGLPVVEDAACATGSEIAIEGNWQKIGKPQGDIACFSFHPRKILTTGDGGMLTTANSDWDQKFRLLRQHGMSVPDMVRHNAREVIFESYPIFGFNYRLTDIQAAVGIVQLSRVDDQVKRRRELAVRYRELLAAIPGLSAPAEPNWARTNWQSYCVRLPEGVDQREVMQKMLDAGIATRRGVMCAHREGDYARKHPRFPLHRSEQAQDHCILLPIFHQLSDDEQVSIVRELGRACAVG